MRFLFRTTLNWGSGGDCPALDEVVEGGVFCGGMLTSLLCYIFSATDSEEADLRSLSPCKQQLFNAPKSLEVALE